MLSLSVMKFLKGFIFKPCCFYIFTGDIRRFEGNQTAVDDFKIMVQYDDFLLIGAT